MKTTENNFTRRNFLKSSLAITALASVGTARLHALELESKAKDKREAVLALLDTSQKPSYVPAAFFMHFGSKYNSGQAAIDRHLEFFRATEMDFLKIQYELGMPHKELKKPTDWASIPRYGEEFFQPMLAVIKGILKEAKKEALVLPTVYSPYMCAKQIAGTETLLRHGKENPEAVAKGMEIITESLFSYLKAAIEAGVDGFYLSTQGAEVNRFGDSEIFEKVVRPFDLALMNEANEKCIFNILHICDYEGKYKSLSPFASYPGHVVNTPVSLEDGTQITMPDAAKMFERPVMGGLDKNGIIAKGTPEQIRQTVTQVLETAPERFILGADCTVGGDSWDTLKTVIRQAHAFRG